MKFYTNITRWGNHLLLREYVNGQRLNRRIKYSPTLYMRVAKPTEYKTLDGNFVTPVSHETMKGASEWVDNYKNQSHLHKFQILENHPLVICPLFMNYRFIYIVFRVRNQPTLSKSH